MRADNEDLPPEIELKTSQVDPTSIGVWSRLPIKAGDRFGPVEGDRVQEAHTNMNPSFVWEIVDVDTKEHLWYIDATDPERGNWMRNIQCARHLEEQNILSQQEGTDIYFRAMKDIPQGVELLTWFENLRLKLGRKRRKGWYNENSFNKFGENGSFHIGGLIPSKKTKRQVMREYNKRNGGKSLDTSMENTPEPSECEDTDTTIGTDTSHCAPTDTVKTKTKTLSDHKNFDENEPKLTKPKSQNDGYFHVEHINACENGTRKQFVCDICFRTYKRSSAFNRHYLNLHISHKYMTKEDMYAYNIIRPIPKSGSQCNMDVSTSLEYNANKGDLPDSTGGKNSVHHLSMNGDSSQSENGIDMNFILGKTELDSKPSLGYICETKESPSIKCSTLLLKNESEACEKSDKSSEDILSGDKDQDIQTKATKKPPYVEASPEKDEAISKEVENRTYSDVTESLLTELRQEPTPSSGYESDPQGSDELSEDKENESNKGAPDQNESQVDTTVKQGLTIEQTLPAHVDSLLCRDIKNDTNSSDYPLPFQSLTSGFSDSKENSIVSKIQTQNDKLSDDNKTQKDRQKNGMETVSMPGLFRCHLCAQVFDTASEIRGHLKAHEGNGQSEDKTWSCDLCVNVFTHRSELVRHKASLHNVPVSGNRCKYCLKDFPSSKNLRRHERTHEGVRLKCPHCATSFSQAGHVRRHVRQIHPTLFHECAFCIQYFAKESLLLEHIKSKHGKSAEENEEEFKKRKGDMGAIDPVMDKAESMRLASKRLYSSKVSDPYKYACTVCKKRFLDYSNMCRHRRLVHLCNLLDSGTNGEKRKEKVFESTSIIRTRSALEREMIDFYANVSDNIFENLTKHMMGTQEMIETSDSLIKWEREAKLLSSFDCNLTPSKPLTNPPILKKCNFPNPFRLTDTNHTYLNVVRKNTKSNTFSSLSDKFKAETADIEANQPTDNADQSNACNFSVSVKTEMCSPKACVVCKLSFSDPRKYRAHMRDEHGVNALDSSKRTTADSDSRVLGQNTTHDSNKPDVNIPVTLQHEKPEQEAILDLRRKEKGSDVEMDLNGGGKPCSQREFLGNLHLNPKCSNITSNKPLSTENPADLFHRYLCNACQREFGDWSQFMEHHESRHPTIERGFTLVHPSLKQVWTKVADPIGVLNVFSANMPAYEDRQSNHCTKCHRRFKLVTDLHKHMIDCADPETMRPKYVWVYQYRKQKYSKMKRKRKCGWQKQSTNTTDMHSSGAHSKSDGLRTGLSTSDESKPEQGYSMEDGYDRTKRRKTFDFTPNRHTRRRQLINLLDAFICSGCGEDMKTISSLERHIPVCSNKDKMTELADGDTASGSESEEDDYDPNKHLCIYCEKQFTYLGSLRNHIFDICPVRKKLVEASEYIDTEWETDLIEKTGGKREPLSRRSSTSSLALTQDDENSKDGSDDLRKTVDKRQKRKRRGFGWGASKAAKNNAFNKTIKQIVSKDGFVYEYYVESEVPIVSFDLSDTFILDVDKTKDAEAGSKRGKRGASKVSAVLGSDQLVEVTHGPAYVPCERLPHQLEGLQAEDLTVKKKQQPKNTLPRKRGRKAGIILKKDKLVKKKGSNVPVPTKRHRVQTTKITDYLQKRKAGSTRVSKTADVSPKSTVVVKPQPEVKKRQRKPVVQVGRIRKETGRCKKASTKPISNAKVALANCVKQKLAQKKKQVTNEINPIPDCQVDDKSEKAENNKSSTAAIEVLEKKAKQAIASLNRFQKSASTIGIIKTRNKAAKQLKDVKLEQTTALPITEQLKKVTKNPFGRRMRLKVAATVPIASATKTKQSPTRVNVSMVMKKIRERKTFAQNPTAAKVEKTKTSVKTCLFKTNRKYNPDIFNMGSDFQATKDCSKREVAPSKMSSPNNFKSKCDISPSHSDVSTSLKDTFDFTEDEESLPPVLHSGAGRKAQVKGFTSIKPKSLCSTSKDPTTVLKNVQKSLSNSDIDQVMCNKVNSASDIHVDAVIEAVSRGHFGERTGNKTYSIMTHDDIDYENDFNSNVESQESSLNMKYNLDQDKLDETQVLNLFNAGYEEAHEDIEIDSKKKFTKKIELTKPFNVCVKSNLATMLNALTEAAKESSVTKLKRKHKRVKKDYSDAEDKPAKRKRSRSHPNARAEGSYSVTSTINSADTIEKSPIKEENVIDKKAKRNCSTDVLENCNPEGQIKSPTKHKNLSGGKKNVNRKTDRSVTVHKAAKNNSRTKIHNGNNLKSVKRKQPKSENINCSNNAFISDSIDLVTNTFCTAITKSPRRARSISPSKMQPSSLPSTSGVFNNVGDTNNGTALLTSGFSSCCIKESFSLVLYSVDTGTYSDATETFSDCEESAFL